MGWERPVSEGRPYQFMSRRYCLALDLKDDAGLMAEYRRYHEEVWPEITKSIRDAGIEEMEIYLVGNRLFMIIEVDEKFSFEEKAKADAGNARVQEWEKLMWKYQQALPGAKAGEKWMRMEKIFEMK
jgi:L-rhamnose mutarotase